MIPPIFQAVNSINLFIYVLFFWDKKEMLQKRTNKCRQMNMSYDKEVITST